MLRIGTLGSSRISQPALIEPSASVPEVTVAAVAARDLPRAEAFALRYGIPKAYGSYQEMLDDPDVDAIYNPLPNSLHGPWTLRAIAAGKHVLCEKPFASNADEAAQVAQAAVGLRPGRDGGHALPLPPADPAAVRGRGRARRGAAPAGLDELRHQRTRTTSGTTSALGGGALMDGGCYAIDCLRLLGASDGHGDEHGRRR